MNNKNSSIRYCSVYRSKFFKFLSGLLLFFTLEVEGQVNVVYNQFFMNPYLYNPAYAGVEGHSVVFGLYKQQWSNLESSPSIANVSFHTPLKGGIGVGAMIFNETQGPLTTTWGKFSTSYLITVDKDHYLRFGMSIGGGNNSLNFGEIDSPTDPAFLNVVPNNSFFIGDFGATYHFGHFNVGFSIPNLITYDVITTESISPVRVSPLDNVMFKMNYRGHLNDEIAIEPHVIYRYSEMEPDLYEGTVILHIKHAMWAGAAYRQDNNLLGLIGFKIKESLAIGYSFELGNSNIASSLGPSHEINIGYHIGTKKDHAEHVSSFIKSHRLSAEERAAKAELEREKKLAALRKSRAPESAVDEDALGLLQTTPPKQVAATIPATEERTNQLGESEKAIVISTDANNSSDSVKAWVPADTADEQWELASDADHRERVNDDGNTEIGLELIRTKNGVSEKVIKWQTIQNDVDAGVTKTKGDPALTEDFRTHDQLATSDIPMKVRKGTHLLELSAGNYVIAGAFENFDNAEDFSDNLFERGLRDAIVGYVSATGYYYVVVYQSDQVSNAQAERNRIKNAPGLAKVWVLTVNE